MGTVSSVGRHGNLRGWSRGYTNRNRSMSRRYMQHSVGCLLSSLPSLPLVLWRALSFSLCISFSRSDMFLLFSFAIFFRLSIYYLCVPRMAWWSFCRRRQVNRGHRLHACAGEDSRVYLRMLRFTHSRNIGSRSIFQFSETFHTEQ